MTVIKIKKQNLYKITGREKGFTVNHCGRIIEVINYLEEDKIYWDVCVNFGASVLHMPCGEDLASLLLTALEEIEKGTI